jgi:hypothetical protein
MVRYRQNPAQYLANLRSPRFAFSPCPKHRTAAIPVVVFVCALWVSPSWSELVTYPAPNGASLSTAYNVLVNDTKVDVYNIPSVHGGDYAMAYFDFSESVTVKIRSAKNLANAIINPVSANLARSMSGDTLVVVLDKPRKISIEPDEINGPLLIFGNPLERNVPKPGDPGVIYFGPGVVTANSISVGTNQTLYLAGGAVVKGGITINGDNATVRGRGILDGSPWEHEAGPQRQMLLINGAKNTHIEGIILASSYAWTVVPRGADTVNITNIKICGSRVMNDDGIDPVNSRNILIDDCFIRTDDDCIAAKGMEADLGNVENIVVQNSIFWCDRARMVLLGHESRAPFMRNIVFRNIEAVHVGPDWPMLLLEPGEEMWLQDIFFENMRFNANTQLVFLQLDPTVNQYMKTQRPGHAKNIHFRNITVNSLPKYGSPAYTFDIHGPDAGHRVDSVSFEDVIRHGQCVRRTSTGVEIGDNTSNIVFTCGPGALNSGRVSPPVSDVKLDPGIQPPAEALDLEGRAASCQPASF